MRACTGGERGRGGASGDERGARKCGRSKKSWEMEGRGNTEVCKLVVHRRRQIGSGSQVVRLSESKANSSHSYYLHLPIALVCCCRNNKMVRGHIVQAADIRSQTGKLHVRDHITAWLPV